MPPRPSTRRTANGPSCASVFAAAPARDEPDDPEPAIVEDASCVDARECVDRSIAEPDVPSYHRAPAGPARSRARTDMSRVAPRVSIMTFRTLIPTRDAVPLPRRAATRAHGSGWLCIHANTSAGGSELMMPRKLWPTPAIDSMRVSCPCEARNDSLLTA